MWPVCLKPRGQQWPSPVQRTDGSQPSAVLAHGTQPTLAAPTARYQGPHQGLLPSSCFPQPELFLSSLVVLWQGAQLSWPSRNQIRPPHGSKPAAWSFHYMQRLTCVSLLFPCAVLHPLLATTGPHNLFPHCRDTYKPKPCPSPPTSVEANGQIRVPSVSISSLSISSPTLRWAPCSRGSNPSHTRCLTSGSTLHPSEVFRGMPVLPPPAVM